MKKFLILILTFAYFASTSGATVYMHYCMGKMVEWNVIGNKKEKCPSCGMDKNKKNDKDCCKDEHKQVKVDEDHYTSYVAFQAMQIAAAALPVSFIEIPAITFSSITEENPTSNAPPQSRGIAIYKRNCVFRI